MVAVYVDDMRARYGRMIMCHMTSDTTQELLDMVDKIGVNRKWIQRAGTSVEHFDICMQKRGLAIQFGAIETTQRKDVLRRKLRKSVPDVRP